MVAGSGRANDIITLPGGDRIHVKVASQDSGGTLLMTKQPIERRGSGPPKHYHEEQDDWFYCLAGEYVVEIGDQRLRLGPGDSVLGPRRVPHAFVYDGAGPGRILLRLEARRGPKKAALAVAASILTAAYHFLRAKVEYHDLGPDYFVRRDVARVAERLANRIRDLGYEVDIRSAA